MEIRLLTKNYKGMFISCYRNSFYIYFHFPKMTYRIFCNNWKFGTDSYSTVGFNQMLKTNRDIGYSKDSDEYLTLLCMKASEDSLRESWDSKEDKCWDNI